MCYGPTIGSSSARSRASLRSQWGICPSARLVPLQRSTLPHIDEPDKEDHNEDEHLDETEEAQLAEGDSPSCGVSFTGVFWPGDIMCDMAIIMTPLKITNAPSSTNVTYSRIMISWPTGRFQAARGRTSRDEI